MHELAVLCLRLPADGASIGLREPLTDALTMKRVGARQRPYNFICFEFNKTDGTALLHAHTLHPHLLTIAIAIATATTTGTVVIIATAILVTVIIIAVACTCSSTSTSTSRSTASGRPSCGAVGRPYHTAAVPSRPVSLEPFHL